FTIQMRHHARLEGPGSGTHMNVYDTISMWDLIEESPVFSDEVRLFVTNRLLEIMRSNEGANGGWFRKGTKTLGVRHNHQTLPGLACLFGGRYFRRGYIPEEAEEWMAAGAALFAGQKVSHKPQCDCNFYEWGTLHQTGSWARASGDLSFFADGVCRTAAERAIIEMDNRGYSSPNGDCWGLRYFPTIFFRQAAEHYRDGRFEWALRKSGIAKATDPVRRGVANVVRDLEPREPTELLGIAVAPMSGDFHNMHNTTMPGQPEANIPLERSFDKISFRASFDPMDHYLLLDGIGMGSHGHVDANGICHFTANDRIWLMDMSYAEAPNMHDHNVVTVMRDGQTSKPPPLAALEHTFHSKDFSCTETLLENYCGQDWRRHVFWRTNRYFLVIDELTAREPGDYTLRCHWRSLGAGKLDGTRFAATQQPRADAGGGIKSIRRPDADNETCLKFVGRLGRLRKVLPLTQGQWTVSVVGCGHHSGDDSLFVDVDGQRVGALHVSQDTISASNPLAFTIAAQGKHEISFTLREGTGTICDKVVLSGPDGAETVIDAFDLDIPKPPSVIDTFALECHGADALSLTRDRDNVGKWFKSYPYAEPVVNIIQQSVSRTMAQGDRHIFANLFFVSSEKKTVDARVRRIDERVFLVRDGEEITCIGLGPATLQLGETKLHLAARGSFAFNANTFHLPKELPEAWLRTPQACELRGKNLQTAWDAATPPTAEAKLPDELRTAGMKAVWTRHLPGEVRDLAAAPLRNGQASVLAVACADKNVHLLDAKGTALWRFETGGAVNSVLVTDVDGDGVSEIVAGSDDSCCYLLAADGSKRWSFEGEKGHDPYWGRYWRAGEVKHVLAADLTGDGQKEIVFGAANMHIHALDSTGKRIWKVRQYGICTSLCAADMTGDGNANIIGGPAEITCVSNCLVIGADGKVLHRNGNDGWASALTAVCTVDLDGVDPLEILCGTNMNNVYALGVNGDKLDRRWHFPAGDIITCLAPVRLEAGVPQAVLAGSRSHYIYALDGQGKHLWSTNLHAPVSHILARDTDGDGRDEILVGAGNRIHLLDTQGAVLAGRRLNSTITSLVPMGADVAVATTTGDVILLRLGK
ncbi:MAG: PQQ-binding-like beta-propeller repeat protein, partial [Lentisphaeria bacterium]|nr:PQQ-binding-like beta-propeller repeat protein [Lentisphaeria bacterium]